MNEEHNAGDLRISGIFIFWVPLAIMWLMMGVEQPGLAAVIARLPNAEDNLAIFGVCFALAVFIESPALQLLSAGTALADSPGNYRRLLNFMHILALGLTSIHLLIALTPLFEFILGTLMGVPEDLIAGCRTPFLVMTPFSAAVGYRRLWQGTLIRAGRTAIIPGTMITRLVATGAGLAVGALSGAFSGAVVAAIGIISGVSIGAIVSGLFCIGVFRPREKTRYSGGRESDVGESGTDIRETENDVRSSGAVPTLSWRYLIRFYGPLAMTSIVFLAARPLLTSGMARSAFPRQSLAVWPALYGFMFLFSSMAISFQEAAIALLARYPRSRRRLGKFATAGAICLSLLFLSCSIPGIREVWFRSVAGLSEELRSFVPIPLLILSVVPFQLFMKSWLRGRFVHTGRTINMTYGVIVYTLTMLVLLWVVPKVIPITGVVVGAAALVIAQGLENLYLRKRLTFVEDPLEDTAEQTV